ncbi:hypothetical protein LCGC14_2020020 [marine sediment metagenome]|uniref:Uncharacterized protein n=1 Tax=marine sediment metagenome TaxID=412755 RepID=A0A0F9HUX7_9ZZZZ
MKESDNIENFLGKDKRQFFSDNLNYAIKNFFNPSFLGSIHLKKNSNPSLKNVENLLANDLDLRLTRSLKNTFLNPVTKTLVILAILFNIFWFLSIYLI